MLSDSMKVALRGIFFFIPMLTVAGIFSQATDVDSVELSNGDVIKGAVIKAEGGALVVKTEYSAEIKIDCGKIKSVTTTHPVDVHLKTGEILKGKLVKGDDGKFAVESETAGKSGSIGWDKLKSINPPPQKWTGNITIGATQQTGNTERVSASFGAEAERATEQDRFAMKFLFNYAEDKEITTARNTYGALKYDYNFSASVYGFLSLEMLSDRFRDLQLRTVVSSGLGYKVVAETDISWEVELGLAYISENFFRGEDDARLGLKVGSKLAWEFIRGISLTDTTIYYPSFEDSSRYIYRNEASVATLLGAGWSLKISNIIDYNNEPPPQVEKRDSLWILGLQYAF